MLGSLLKQILTSRDSYLPESSATNMTWHLSSYRTFCGTATHVCRGDLPLCFAVAQLLLQLVLHLLAVQQLRMGLIQFGLEVCFALIQLVVQAQQVCIPVAHCHRNSLLDCLLQCGVVALLQQPLAQSRHVRHDWYLCALAKLGFPGYSYNRRAVDSKCGTV